MNGRIDVRFTPESWRGCRRPARQLRASSRYSVGLPTGCEVCHKSHVEPDIFFRPSGVNNVSSETLSGMIDVHFHLIPQFYREAVRDAGTMLATASYPDWSPQLALDLMDKHDARSSRPFRRAGTRLQAIR
jgi:hypothetical protein